MGKLTFKGDKRKKRKSTDKEERPEAPKKIKSDNINLDGWSTADSVEDLKGACIVLASAEDDRTTVVQVEDGKVATGDDFEVVEDTVNFFGGTEYARIHKCEPNTVKQVFTLIPVNEYEKSKLDTRRTNRFALKTSQGQYLSTTQALVHAIGDNEIFTFKRVGVRNEQYAYDETWWEICNKSGQWVLETSDGSQKLKFVDAGTVAEGAKAATETKFVIRVHSKNTVKGGQLLLGTSDVESGPELGSIIRQLYKDTNGRIEVNSALIKRLKSAISKGDVNEQIIQEKSKFISKW